MLEEKAYARTSTSCAPSSVSTARSTSSTSSGSGESLRGDLGESLWTKRPVVEELARRLPVTLELALMAIAVRRPDRDPGRRLSATRQDTLRDYAARSAAILGLSVPGFWLATLVIVLPAIWWGWRPATRLRRVLPGRPSPHLAQLLLPALILGIASAAAIMRLTRGMLLEVLRQDYVRTAWAKGLRERVVVLKHSLRNAIIPVVTVLGIQLAQVLGGTVIIETIFGLPGHEPLPLRRHQPARLSGHPGHQPGRRLRSSS